MPDANPNRRKRAKLLYKQTHEELCRLLYDLDPEVIAKAFDNPHWDEYSLEVNAILPRLTRANSLEEAKVIIHDEFHRWFGAASLIDESLDEVAAAVWRTFNLVWRQPQVGDKE